MTVDTQPQELYRRSAGEPTPAHRTPAHRTAHRTPAGQHGVDTTRPRDPGLDLPNRPLANLWPW